MKRIISLFLIASMLFSFASCTDGGTTNEVVRSREISRVYFNTVSTIYTYAKEDEANIDKYAGIADEMLSYYHRLFDIYYEYSELKNIRTINKKAGKEAVKVDRELIEFLLYCKELYTLTGGTTNIMLGSVLKIWHDVREEAEDDFGYLAPSELPTQEALASAAEHTSIDALIINEEESTVYISDPKASIDVGAIAKGYAVELLYNRLKDEGATSVVLNIGGNLRTIGTKPDGSKWTAGITNPDRTSDETLICRISIADTSVVTSGDYERYFIAGDTEYHHIIDPKTLMPARYFSSVTIITRHSGLADALSTALFCMSYEEGLMLIESIGETDVIWVNHDGTMQYTDGIEFVQKVK